MKYFFADVLLSTITKMQKSEIVDSNSLQDFSDLRNHNHKTKHEIHPFDFSRISLNLE